MGKLIGIVAQPAYKDEVFGVHNDYLTLAERFGTPVIISPMDSIAYFRIYRSLDGIILPGGADVDSKRYTILPSMWAGKPNIWLEHFDKEILPLLVEQGIPMFGICRGLQTLNVYFAGTLWQHLWKHPKSQHNSHLVHPVYLQDTSKYEVNSFHHQGIARLGKGLVSTAKSGDGLVEAFQHITLPIAAVQWHPERLGEYDQFSLGIMKRLFS